MQELIRCRNSKECIDICNLIHITGWAGRSLFELKSTKDMATALGCSPQFADFNHIAQAVGHHVLQHLIVFLALCIARRSQIYRDIAHHTDPILSADSISSPPI